LAIFGIENAARDRARHKRVDITARCVARTSRFSPNPWKPRHSYVSRLARFPFGCFDV